MQPHIGRWHTRYRVIGERGSGSAFLENAVRPRVAEVYAAAVDRARFDDPAVYVLRRVHTELTVVGLSTASEAETAQRWAARIFADAMHAITCDTGRTELVMRFEDTADYVAHFLADLLGGKAWERWYYGAFSVYRGLELSEAVRRILIDFADELPAVFRRLADMGRLRAVISRVSRESAGDIWRTAIRRMPEASPEEFRIFLRTAIALSDALELWTDAHPLESELLLQYIRTAPPEPDWKQPHALAGAVYTAFHFLDGIGLLSLDAPGVLERFDRLGEPILDSLEWLDHEWLTAALRAHLSSKSTVSAVAVRTRPAALSPLQLRVLELLWQLLEAGTVTLPEPDPQSHANALALFAAVSSAESTLAGHSATPAIIEWLLARWKESGASPSETAFPPAQRLASRIAVILQREVISPHLPQSQESLLPKAPAPKLEALALRSHKLLQGDLIESSCAGVFLLSRAVLEGRATQLAAALGLSPPAGPACARRRMGGGRSR